MNKKDVAESLLYSAKNLPSAVGYGIVNTIEAPFKYLGRIFEGKDYTSDSAIRAVKGQSRKTTVIGAERKRSFPMPKDEFEILRTNIKDSYKGKLTKDGKHLNIENKIYRINGDFKEDKWGYIQKLAPKIAEARKKKVHVKNYKTLEDGIINHISKGVYLPERASEDKGSIDATGYLLPSALAILSATAIFFAFSESTITGNTISSGLSTTSNGIGLTICLLGILGITLYKKFK